MSQKRSYDIKCAECGKRAKVFFKPVIGKPTYCKSCFSKRRMKQQVVGVRGNLGRDEDILGNEARKNPLASSRNYDGDGVMGKRKILTEQDFSNMVLPVGSDVLGIAMKMLGYGRIMVKCQDGPIRLCRIRGKMKRRNWIRLGDVVLVSPWDFQSDTRGDIFWRYRRNQNDWLRKKGYLTIER